MYKCKYGEIGIFINLNILKRVSSLKLLAINLTCLFAITHPVRKYCSRLITLLSCYQWNYFKVTDMNMVVIKNSQNKNVISKFGHLLLWHLDINTKLKPCNFYQCKIKTRQMSSKQHKFCAIILTHFFKDAQQIL